MTDDLLSGFDSTPEDGWDADDSVPEQLDNLRRRVRLLRDSLDAVTDDQERLRFKNLDIDMAFIIQRLIDG